MKKQIAILTAALLLTSCGQTKDEQLVGYWMGPYGGTISFTDAENCAFGDEHYTYKVYDDDHIQLISSDGTVQDLTFDLKNDKLYLKYSGTDSYEEYTKDEAEQQEIIQRNQEEEQEQQATQRLEAEKSQQIAELQAGIEEQESLIEDALWKIENNKADIQKWKNDIKMQMQQCEEAIAFGDDREYQENQRDEFIAADNESIADCQKRIKELRKEIKGYKANIKRVRKQIKKIKGE